MAFYLYLIHLVSCYSYHLAAIWTLINNTRFQIFIDLITVAYLSFVMITKCPFKWYILQCYSRHDSPFKMFSYLHQNREFQIITDVLRNKQLQNQFKINDYGYNSSFEKF